MGPAALLCALLGVAAVALPAEGKYLALGLGLLGIGLGLIAYRGPGTSPRRLAGAAGVAVGILAAALGGLKVALTLIAMERLGRLL